MTELNFASLLNVNPTQLSQTLHTVKSLLEEKSRDEIVEKVKREVKVEVLNEGFPPVAVAFPKGVGFCSSLVALLYFSETVRKAVVSPDVVADQNMKTILDVLNQKFEVEIVEIDFTSEPKYEHANILKSILKQGSIIVTALPLEVALWLARNAGLRRIAVFRPMKDRAVLKFY